MNGSSINHLNHLRVLDRAKVHQSDTKIISLAPRSDFEIAQLQQIPPALWSRLRLYSRFTPFTRSSKNLTRDWMSCISMGEKESEALIVPDSGATLARLLAIGVLSRFRRIVLLGVDLSTAYFWEEESSVLASPEFREFPQPNRGGIHATVRTDIRPFSILDIVSAYRVICDSREIILQIGNESSPLSSCLSPFDW